MANLKKRVQMRSQDMRSARTTILLRALKEKQRKRLERQRARQLAMGDTLAAAPSARLPPTFATPQSPAPTQHKTQTFTLLAIRVSPQTNYGLVIPLYRPLHVPDWSGESYFHQVSGQTKRTVAEMRESIFNESCFHPQGGCIRVCVGAETQAPDEAPPVRPVDGSISMTAVGERFCEGLLLPDRSVIVAPRGHFLRLLGDRQYGLLAEFPQVMLDASLLDRDPDRLVESFLRCARQLPNGPRRQRHWDALRLEWLRDGDESTVPLPQYDDICGQIR